MLKAMVFIDFENFEIEKNKFFGEICKDRDEPFYSPKLDYKKFPSELLSEAKLPCAHLLNTFIFAPRPDDFLMKDEGNERKYSWIQMLNKNNYITVIEGRHVARPVKGCDMSIDDKNSYTVDEKGTDVNLATHLLTKGFHNAFDIAIIVSGDTDYIPVIDVLRTIGKTVIICWIENRLSHRFDTHVDAKVMIGEKFFNDNKYTNPKLTSIADTDTKQNTSCGVSTDGEASDDSTTDDVAQIDNVSDDTIAHTQGN